MHVHARGRSIETAFICIIMKRRLSANNCCEDVGAEKDNPSSGNLAPSNASSRRRLNKKTRVEDHDDDDQHSDSVQIVRGPTQPLAERQSEWFGIRLDMWKKMKQFNLPFALFNILWWMGRQSLAEELVQVVDYIEWFSGVQSVRKGVAQYGYTAMAFDVCNDALGDFISLEGMLTAFLWLCRCVHNAGHHFATVCSTWIWLSRSSTLRSDAQPLGLVPRSETVNQANEQVSLMALYIWIIHAAGGSWVLEQPASSLMIEHPRMQQLKAYFKDRWQETGFCMGAYGHQTLKPTKLYSCDACVQMLKKDVPPELREKLTENEKKLASVDEIGGVTGGSDLKSSQAYPMAYGAAVGKMFHTKRTSVQNVSDSDDDNDDFNPTDLWEDTKLCKMARWAGVPTDRLMC